MTTTHQPFTVRDDTSADMGARLLDELDDLIGEVEDAMKDSEQARLTITDVELELSVREASATLEASGSNETQRKAAATLALHGDAEYRHLQSVQRDAKGILYAAERRLTVAKYRARLIHAAIALLAPGAYPGREQ